MLAARRAAPPPTGRRRPGRWCAVRAAVALERGALGRPRCARPGEPERLWIWAAGDPRDARPIAFYARRDFRSRPPAPTAAIAHPARRRGVRRHRSTATGSARTATAPAPRSTATRSRRCSRRGATGWWSSCAARPAAGGLTARLEDGAGPRCSPPPDRTGRSTASSIAACSPAVASPEGEAPRGARPGAARPLGRSSALGPAAAAVREPARGRRRGRARPPSGTARDRAPGDRPSRRGARVRASDRVVEFDFGAPGRPAICSSPCAAREPDAAPAALRARRRPTRESAGETSWC